RKECTGVASGLRAVPLGLSATDDRHLAGLIRCTTAYHRPWTNRFHADPAGRVLYDLLPCPRSRGGGFVASRNASIWPPSTCPSSSINAAGSRKSESVSRRSR